MYCCRFYNLYVNKQLSFNSVLNTDIFVPVPEKWLGFRIHGILSPNQFWGDTRIILRDDQFCKCGSGIILTDDKFWCNRGIIFMDDHFWCTTGVIFTDEQFWVEQRRFALRHMREFGFGRRLARLEDVMKEEIQDMLDLLNGRREDKVTNDA